MNAHEYYIKICSYQNSQVAERLLLVLRQLYRKYEIENIKVRRYSLVTLLIHSNRTLTSYATWNLLHMYVRIPPCKPIARRFTLTMEMEKL